MRTQERSGEGKRRAGDVLGRDQWGRSEKRGEGRGGEEGRRRGHEIRVVERRGETEEEGREEKEGREGEE